MHAKVGKFSADNTLIEDVGNLFSSLNVEDAIQEIGLTSTDTGTHVKISRAGVVLFRIEKSTGNMQVSGGYDTDTNL